MTYVSANLPAERSAQRSTTCPCIETATRKSRRLLHDYRSGSFLFRLLKEFRCCSWFLWIMSCRACRSSVSSPSRRDVSCLALSSITREGFSCISQIIEWTLKSIRKSLMIFLCRIGKIRGHSRVCPLILVSTIVHRYQYVMSLTKTRNPNPSPTGKKFGFLMFGGGRWIRILLGASIITF